MAGDPDSDRRNGAPPLRADARRSRERILAAAAPALARNPRLSMHELAELAGVGRSTLYRHFPTRGDLDRALHDGRPEQAPVPAASTPRRSGEAGEGGAHDRRTAMGRGDGTGARTAPGDGRVGRDDGGDTLDARHVLEAVAPHLVADQIVAEARRVTGVPVALYVVDIDGTHLLRLAGSEEFPDRIDAPLALGPELAPEGLTALYERLTSELPGCVPAPLWLRGRAVGLLLAVRAPARALRELAQEAALAIEIAKGYTDAFDAARRRKQTTAAAEIQQNLLPPRIARVGGAEIAGSVLPSYDVGSDWFDYAENRDGTWLAIADAAGRGPMAAGLGSIGLGALRAARRAGDGLEAAARTIHHVLHDLGDDEVYMSAVVARWHPAASLFTWVNCGHPVPQLVRVDGGVEDLGRGGELPFGLGGRDRALRPDRRRLELGDRVVLYSDGVLDRPHAEDGSVGLAGLRRAIHDAAGTSAAATATAVQNAVLHASPDDLEDDAALLVLAVA